MKELKLQKQQSYINVMETLVVQEIEQQLEQLPPRVRQYVKLEEIVTYALNRLPALYASSEQGWDYQCQLAERKLPGKISAAVRQAIVAVQVDPLRLSKPIQVSQNKDAEAVLKVLRSLFQIPDLDWLTAFEKLSALNRQAKTLGSPSLKANHPQSFRPGTYGSERPWVKRQSQQTAGSAHRGARRGTEPTLGWDDPRYCL
ncbi:MAG: late competence development ComFB family protein [Cyanobacteria bacterium P01_F01_bin.86]